MVSSIVNRGSAPGDSTWRTRLFSRSDARASTASKAAVPGIERATASTLASCASAKTAMSSNNACSSASRSW
jgi:hypothetical protein